MADGYISTDEDEKAAEAWQPVPIESNLTEQNLSNFISAKRRKSDIISTLVNIYGSQEEFIKVYMEMLDERLLQAPSMTYEKELKDLELMKLRFGDKNLHQCEVMLRDIKDSERINREVQKQIKEKREG